MNLAKRGWVVIRRFSFVYRHGLWSQLRGIQNTTCAWWRVEFGFSAGPRLRCLVRPGSVARAAALTLQPVAYATRAFSMPARLEMLHTCQADRARTAAFGPLCLYPCLGGRLPALCRHAAKRLNAPSGRRSLAHEVSMQTPHSLQRLTCNSSRRYVMCFPV